jgi:hypothetical protein
VTTLPAAPPPAPKKDAMLTPKAGNNTNTASVSYNAGANTLSFSPGAVNFATYFNGTTVNANAPGESVIGAQIQIGDMQILGPDASVPGAFDLSDSGVSLTEGGVTLLQGELINDLLIPDPDRPGFATIQGSMSFLTEGVMMRSRYVSEFFGDSSESDLFFETDILAATGNLGGDGQGFGTVQIASVAGIPEPGAWGLMLVGLAGLGAALRSRRGMGMA